MFFFTKLQYIYPSTSKKELAQIFANKKTSIIYKWVNTEYKHDSRKNVSHTGRKNGKLILAELWRLPDGSM
jgi:hypothetical protein